MADKLVDIDLFEGKYDASNQLVLLSKKKEKANKKVVVKQEKILSRSKRKELQKQVAKKQKKLTRNELWKELEVFNNCGTDTHGTDHLFSRNRKTEKRVQKLAQSSLRDSKKWRQGEFEPPVSIDTDDFSSSEEVEVAPQARFDDTSKKDVAMIVEPKYAESLDSVASVRTVQQILHQPTVKSKAKYVLVNRDPEIQTARLALPIVAEEARIMEKISENDVVIICGATGCGKTTQIPQFLYEAGYTRGGYKIGVTEPRRVAAISMSERVSKELNLIKGEVAYHIRYEKNTSSKTEIKFMTDGILLQEMKRDFQLAAYSAILIDEAHERSVYTDVLLGLLSLAIRLRRKAFTENPVTSRLPLKLIIMSATLRVEDFAENRRLFPLPKTSQRLQKAVPIENAGDDDDDDDGVKKQRLGAPPVLQVESRQFPVTCHFARRTPDDYLKAAFRKVVSVHKDSPPGGILVFVTGQQEVKTLCNWFTKAFPTHEAAEVVADSIQTIKTSERTPEERAKNRNVAKEAEEVELKELHNEGQIDINVLYDLTEEDETPTDSRFNLDNFDIIPVDEETELGLRSQRKSLRTEVSNDKKALTKEDSETDEEEDGEYEINEELLRQFHESHEKPAAPIHALPLYSLLPAQQQKRVFEEPPQGHRLVVVATNVAETSLTIPNIRYVVDTGRVKSKIYDTSTGASCFRIVWVSQASAEQRAGRAGRVGPGHCYRLYSSGVFKDKMEAFSAPDILTRPIDEVVLLLKSYLGSTPLSCFPLPTPPTPNAVEAAERRLTALGALEEKKVGTGTVRVITAAGRWMARIPLPARFARMLLFANQQNLLPYAVVLVAALSVPDFFLPDVPTAEKHPEPEEDTTSLAGHKRMHAHIAEADRIAQTRTNFLRQFVKTDGDLMLGDLAVLMGAVCCMERYWAQLVGTVAPEESISPLLSRVARLSPEATMRQLVQRCGVRWKAYVEVRQLRRQLTDILNANIPDLKLEVDPALPKPTLGQVEQLRQLFLVGSVCHVAAKYDLPVDGLLAKDRRRLRYAYKVSGVSEPVFIETSSPLARENCSFIAFTELYTSSKPYLRNVCAINPAWIPFLAPHSYRVEGVSVMENATNTDEAPSLAASASLPCPFYDAERDSVMAYAKRIVYVGADLGEAGAATLAESGLELPSLYTPFPLVAGSPAAQALTEHDCLVWSVRWFARSLLEGRVYRNSVAPWFPKAVKTAIPTRMVTLSYGLVRKEVRDLFSKMLSKKVNSKQILDACLESDPSFISKELMAWLEPKYHSDFTANWPPHKQKGSDEQRST